MENAKEDVMTYYSCQSNLEKRFDRTERLLAYGADTQEGFQVWKQQLRSRLKELLGLEQMQYCPMEIKEINTVELEDDIVRSKILLKIEEEVWMPIYVLWPKSIFGTNMVKCVIAPHGHMSGGKSAVAGEKEIPAIAKQIEVFNYDYGLQIAKLGYLVYCPDARGFGERREVAIQGISKEALIGSSCNQLAHMAEPLGMTVAGMHVFDLMRLVDHIQAQQIWKIESIGCAGFSGGGQQTLWLAALDDRIDYGIISGYMYGYKESLLKLNGNCGCNYVPHLWQYVDMGDIGALIAPRPLMIQSCKEDHLNGSVGLDNVSSQMAILQKAYDLHEAGAHLYHDIREGGHCWHQAGVDEFLGAINKET